MGRWSQPGDNKSETDNRESGDWVTKKLMTSKEIAIVTMRVFSSFDLSTPMFNLS